MRIDPSHPTHPFVLEGNGPRSRSPIIIAVEHLLALETPPARKIDVQLLCAIGYDGNHAAALRRLAVHRRSLFEQDACIEELKALQQPLADYLARLRSDYAPAHQVLTDATHFDLVRSNRVLEHHDRADIWLMSLAGIVLMVGSVGQMYATMVKNGKESLAASLPYCMIAAGGPILVKAYYNTLSKPAATRFLKALCGATAVLFVTWVTLHGITFGAATAASGNQSDMIAALMAGQSSTAQSNAVSRYFFMVAVLTEVCLSSIGFCAIKQIWHKYLSFALNSNRALFHSERDLHSPEIHEAEVLQARLAARIVELNKRGDAIEAEDISAAVIEAARLLPHPDLRMPPPHFEGPRAA